MSREESLKRLNELFAEELEAAIRYLHLAATVKGLDRLLVRDTLLSNMNETLDHAQTIAEKMVHLGGAPGLDLKLRISPEKTSGADAIRTALAFEQAALDAYREFLDSIKDQDDVVLEEFLRAQVAPESEHVAELYGLLETSD